MQDVLLPKFTLLSIELRVAVDGHLNNLLFGNQNHLSFAGFFCWRTNLQSCCLCILSFLFWFLNALREHSRVELARFVVHLRVIVPSFVVCLYNLCRILTISNGFVKVLTVQRSLAVSSARPFEHWVHDLMVLDLHILIIEMPFAQFEITVTKQGWILDLIFIYHLFELWNRSLLLHRIVIIFIQRQFDLGQLMLNPIGLPWATS